MQHYYTKAKLNDVELCFFAALVHGLRLVNEKSEEFEKASKDRCEKYVEPEIDAGALAVYVQAKGQHLVTICGLDPGKQEDGMYAYLTEPNLRLLPKPKKVTREKMLTAVVQPVSKSSPKNSQIIPKCRFCGYDRPANSVSCPSCGMNGNARSSAAARRFEAEMMSLRAQWA